MQTANKKYEHVSCSVYNLNRERHLFLKVFQEQNSGKTELHFKLLVPIMHFSM